MTVDELEIEGFKPLKSLKFDEGDLGMVNVITGRNNTGKSSILEAIDLLYNPSHLEEYSSKASELINKGSDSCSMFCEGHQLIIEPVNDTEPATHYKNLILSICSQITIRKSSEQHMIDPESKDIAQTTLYGGMVGKPFFEFAHEELDMTQLEVTDSILENLEGDIVSTLNEELLIIEGEDYKLPYFHPKKGKFDKIAESILDLAHNMVVQEVDEPEEVSLAYTPTNFGFFSEVPVDTQHVKLIKTPVTDVSDYEPENEDDAVKIDDIEDYITERGLVDNLKDFDLDYLVFEEDGEKDSVPFDFMGDGFKSMVGILWEIVDEDESEIVMIEEPENHMHPGYVREMFDFLVTMAREDDVQLFVTTHSIDFLNYMFDENLPEEHRKFLEEELSVIRMESPEFVEVLDYEEAEEKSEKLQLDLRGI